MSIFWRYTEGAGMRSVLAFLIASTLAVSARTVAAAPSCDAIALESEATRARVWRYTWSGVNAGLMVGSFVAVPLVERESRPDWIVSGVGSGITLLATWFFPLRVEDAAEELADLPPAERARRLPALLRESALDERERVTWPWHVANLGLSAAGGAVIAFGFDHYLSGALTAVGAAALGELQLFTQPTGLAEDCGVACRFTPRLGFALPREGAPASWGLTLHGAF